MTPPTRNTEPDLGVPRVEYDDLHKAVTALHGAKHYPPPLVSNGMFDTNSQAQLEVMESYKELTSDRAVLRQSTTPYFNTADRKVATLERH